MQFSSFLVAQPEAVLILDKQATTTIKEWDYAKIIYSKYAILNVLNYKLFYFTEF